jgi:hypothetical protein
MAADNTTDNAGLIPTRQLADRNQRTNRHVRPHRCNLTRHTSRCRYELSRSLRSQLQLRNSQKLKPFTIEDVDQNAAFVTVDVKKFAGAAEILCGVAAIALRPCSSMNESHEKWSRQYAKQQDTAIQRSSWSLAQQQTAQPSQHIQQPQSF